MEPKRGKENGSKNQDERPDDFETQVLHKTQVLEQPEGFEDNYELNPDLSATVDLKQPDFANLAESQADLDQTTTLPNPEFDDLQESQSGLEQTTTLPKPEFADLQESSLDRTTQLKQPEFGKLQDSTEQRLAEARSKLGIPASEFGSQDFSFPLTPDGEVDLGPEDSLDQMLATDANQFESSEQQMSVEEIASGLLSSDPLENQRAQAQLSQLSPEEKVRLNKEMVQIQKQQSEKQSEYIRFGEDILLDSAEVLSDKAKPQPFPEPRPFGIETDGLPGADQIEQKPVTRGGEFYREYGQEFTKEEFLEAVKRAGESASSKAERIQLENEFLVNRAIALGVPDELAERLVIHKRIGLLNKLASQGAMGSVFEAVNMVETGTELANDIVKFAYAEKLGAAGLERFKQEAIVAANMNLKQRGIVDVRTVDFSQPDIGYMMVLHKAEGNDLKQELEKGPMDPERAVKIALSVAKSLQSLHDAGLVHRDIKPANLFLNQEELTDVVTGQTRIKESVMVGDLGLVSSGEGFTTNTNEELKDLNLTNSDAIVGTPLFMAPEQLQGKELDEKTDTYALGATLFQLLTQKSYVEGVTSVTELLARIVSGSGGKLLDLVVDDPSLAIPADLASLVDWMLDPDPELRPTDEELISALEAIKTGDDLPKEISSRVSLKGARFSRVTPAKHGVLGKAANKINNAGFALYDFVKGKFSSKKK